MRLLIVHQNAPAQYRHVIRHFVERPGNEVVVMCQKNGKDVPGTKRVTYEVPPGPGPVHRYLRIADDGIRTGEAAMKAALDLRSQGFAPDIILGHNAWGETLFLKDVWPNAKLLSYFEFYYQARGADSGFDPEWPGSFDDFPRTRAMNAINVMGMQAADWGQTPTLYQRDRYPESFHSKISVFHEGIDTTVLAPNPRVQLVVPNGPTLSVNDEVITYVSRSLEPYRGFHVFMRTLPEILRRRPKATVLVIGGDDVSYGAKLAGDKTFREALIEEQKGGIDLSRVHFLGRVPYDFYRGVLQVSSVHVYLTYPFVLSWSLLEAMSTGCMIVGSRTPPVMEAISHGETGLLTDFFNRQELADRIDEALDDREKSAAMRMRARELAVGRYDLRSICLPQYLRVIDDLVNGRAPPAGVVPLPDRPVPVVATETTEAAPAAPATKPAPVPPIPGGLPPGPLLLKDAIALAVEAEKAGNPQRAEALYRMIVSQKPDLHAVQYKLGILLYNQRRFADAADCLLAAAQAAPDIAHYNADLGVACKHLNRFRTRVSAYRRAALLDPGSPSVLMNLGSATIDAGRIREAERILSRALRIAPDNYGVLTNLGNAHMRLGMLEQAETDYRRALSLRPDAADTRKNLGMCLLQQGNLPAGAAFYEARRKGEDFVRRDFTQPEWDGSPFPGKTLLLHAEQGLGDTLQFCRFAAMAKARGGRVVLEAQAPLVSLLRAMDDVDEVVPMGGHLPPFDTYLPLLSAMKAFGTTLETVPAQVPYLKVDPKRRARWEKTLADDPRPKVGIAWAGSPTFAGDRHRTIPLELFGPLLERKDIVFHSLQVGAARDELRKQNWGDRLKDSGAQFRDFAETAALVDQLDLVISVDTAVAHLAGALARPVWIGIAFAATDWRWLLGRDDSPWYPTARLFRQGEDLDWSATIAQIGDALDAWLAARG